MKAKRGRQRKRRNIPNRWDGMVGLPKRIVSIVRVFCWCSFLFCFSSTKWHFYDRPERFVAPPLFHPVHRRLLIANRSQRSSWLSKPWPSNFYRCHIQAPIWPGRVCGASETKIFMSLRRPRFEGETWSHYAAHWNIHTMLGAVFRSLCLYFLVLYTTKSVTFTEFSEIHDHALWPEARGRGGMISRTKSALII